MVLDIKNKQLHQHEKMMMELDKLVRAGALSQTVVHIRRGTLSRLIYTFASRRRSSHPRYVAEGGGGPDIA